MGAAWFPKTGTRSRHTRWWWAQATRLILQVTTFSVSDSSSSSTSSSSSDSSSEETDSDDDIDDTGLLLEIRRKLAATASVCEKKPPEPEIKAKPEPEKLVEELKVDEPEVEIISSPLVADRTVEKRATSIDERLKEQFNLLKDDESTPKKRRAGLVEEIIISVSVGL